MRSVWMVAAAVAVVGVMMAPVASYAQVPDGIWKKSGEGTLVSLSADAHRKVAQDRVVVTLSLEKDGKTPQEVQKFINDKMQEAIKTANGYKDVKSSTTGYNVWQQFDPMPVVDGKAPAKPKAPTWRGSQQLTLDAPAGDSVLKLAGELQNAGFAMQGMNYYLSREASDKLTNDLTREALGTIDERAQGIASSLGLPKVKYEWVGTGDMPQPRPVMFAAAKAMRAEMAMDAGVGPAVGLAGESEVNVSVQAVVRLTK